MVLVRMLRTLYLINPARARADGSNGAKGYCAELSFAHKLSEIKLSENVIVLTSKPPISIIVPVRKREEKCSGGLKI